MQHNPHKVALVFAALMGGWHVVWSVLVVLGWGQPLINFVLWAHMIQVPYVVGPFDLVASVILIVFTAVMGYVGGYLIGLIWNRVHRV